MNLTPNWKYLKDFRKCDEEFKGKQKRNYDTRHRVRQLPSLPQGTEVWVTTGNRQTRGHVTSSSNSPRSYIVNTADGQLRRNTQHLRPTPSEQPLFNDRDTHIKRECPLAQPRVSQYVPGHEQTLISLLQIILSQEGRCDIRCLCKHFVPLIFNPFTDSNAFWRRVWAGQNVNFLQTCYSMFFQVTPTFLVSLFLKYHKQSNGIKNKVIDAISKKKMPSKV